MNSIKLLDFKRVGYLAAVFALLLSATLPSLAFADQATERSIELSNSSVSATNVSYHVKFKAAAGAAVAGAFVIEFCKNSPAIDALCTAPVNFSAAGAASTTTGFTGVAGSTGKVVVTASDTFNDGDAVDMTLTGINNPSEALPLYARIVTYTDATAAGNYASGAPGTHIDDGGVAMSITPTIGVSGSVLESLIFCASAAAISTGCTGSLTAPNVVLGTDGVLGNTISTGTIHSQISTNAATGAVVNLKSSTAGCGGLMLAGESDPVKGCGIKPLTVAAATIDPSAAKFGVKLAGVGNGSGTITPVPNYGTTNFFMNYVDNNSGVTSTYGDPIYNTTAAPISDGAVDLTFGANISNDTPAGAYSATLNLIATGKF